MTDARPTAAAERARFSARFSVQDVARHGPRARGFVTWMLGLLAGSLLWAAGMPARATVRDGETDPPARVGRIVELQGNVSRYDQEEGQWSDAERNRPLTTGDRLSTAGGARVELRVGSTSLRLGGGTELEVVRLDDERLIFQLHSGSLAVRVRSREKAAEVDIVTREARLLPLRAGHYRIDRIDDTTYAASWSGDLRVADADRLTASNGQRLELRRDSGGALRHVWRGLPNDAFASWAMADDQRDERTASSRYISPEMTGAEDLDRWGTWDRHPEHGAIWYPRDVDAGWAPYRHGRWVWVRPWGWTWVDEARWGFAPFHYGRWVHWRDRWCWAPGTYVQRPVYAPAMVAWVGGPSVSVSVHIGGPPVAWVPLAPRERYVPYYRATPVYIDRVNVNPRFQQPGQPQTVPGAPVAYTNQGVPGGVTAVPRDVLVRREPVARAVVSVPDMQRAPAMAAPAAPVSRVQVAPTLSTVPTAPTAPTVSTAPTAPAGRVATPRDMAPDDGRPGQAGRRAEPAAVDSAPRERERRDPREGRDRTDGRGSGGDVRPIRPVPSGQPAPAVPPAAVAQPRVPSPPAPAAGPTPPRQSAAPVVQAPPAAQAAPVQRVQPAAPRAAADDDRKRSGQASRQGEREREATR